MDESAVNLTEKVAANERSMANLRPHQFKPGESGNPRGGRRKGALALVKSVIGDAREQLAMLERISRGEGIVLTYSDRKGRKRRKLLWPTLTDARKCAIYLVERRWGKLPAYSPSDATAEPITGFDGAQLPDGLRLKLREVARELVLEYAPPDAHRIDNPISTLERPRMCGFGAEHSAPSPDRLAHIRHTTFASRHAAAESGPAVELRGVSRSAATTFQGRHSNDLGLAGETGDELEVALRTPEDRVPCFHPRENPQSNSYRFVSSRPAY